MKVMNNGIETKEDNSTSEDKGYIKIEKYNERAIKKLADNYKQIIELLGEDTEREGLKNTPVRTAKAMQFLTYGYGLNPEKIVQEAMFKEEYQHMVIVKDIEIYSLCEHHILPFIGKA
ncbi:unnamed protein product, partial [marine sediment metagenome]